MLNVHACLPIDSLQHGWEVANGRVVFKAAAAAADGGDSGGEQQEPAAAAALPSLDIIQNMMAYAREVERII